MIIALEKITQQCLPIVKDVGDFIQQNFGDVSAEEIEVKDLNSFVSYVDQEAEKMLVEQLQKLLPESTFQTEEETVAQSNSACTWIIDPLDGTTNFLQGIPVFSISVASSVEDRIVLGIIHEVNRNETFYAWEKGGAYLNGKQINVSQKSAFKDAFIGTGFPYNNFDDLDSLIGVLHLWMKKTRGIRRLGSAAVDMAYVACGRLDAYVECKLNPWDISAGLIIVREAGGFVSDFNGNHGVLSGDRIIASNKNYYAQIFDDIQKGFKMSG